MNWEEILKAWGVPALVGAMVAVATLLLNRKLPFQQKLNDVQLQELNAGLKAVIVSNRSFINHLHKIIYEYPKIKADAAGEATPEEVRQMLFQSFLVPEYIDPIQDLMFSLVTPRAVVQAVAEYQVALLATPVAAMRIVDTGGPDYAWQCMMNEGNKPLQRLTNIIRATLGIDSLTDLNRYHSESGGKRVLRWLQGVQNRILLRKPASSYESLLFTTQLSRLRAIVEADLGSGKDEPHLEEILEQSEEPVATAEDVVEAARMTEGSRFDDPVDDAGAGRV